jgi:hypothetical protein
VIGPGPYYPLGNAEDMSEGEYQLAYADLPAPETSPIPKGFWRVRGGALLEIQKMTDEHIANALAFFEERGTYRHVKLDELREEQRRRKGKRSK